MIAARFLHYFIMILMILNFIFFLSISSSLGFEKKATSTV